MTLILGRAGKGVIMANIRVAAIQMQAKVGAVASNLSHAESLVREAFRGGAEWVILPEFFTTAGAFNARLGVARCRSTAAS
jgi:predicted amidohydrolase